MKRTIKLVTILSLGALAGVVGVIAYSRKQVDKLSDKKGNLTADDLTTLTAATLPDRVLTRLIEDGDRK